MMDTDDGELKKDSRRIRFIDSPISHESELTVSSIPVTSDSNSSKSDNKKIIYRIGHLKIDSELNIRGYRKRPDGSYSDSESDDNGSISIQNNNGNPDDSDSIQSHHQTTGERIEFTKLTNWISTVSLNDNPPVKRTEKRRRNSADARTLASTAFSNQHSIFLNNDSNEEITIGDLIEIRCLCKCIRSRIPFRESLKYRKNFRRSLTQSDLRISLNPLNLIRKCLPFRQNRTKKSLLMKINRKQCSYKCFHYVYVGQIDRDNGGKAKQIWCYHVKACQDLIKDEENGDYGIILFETLDQVIANILIEAEKRHSGKKSKLAIRLRIRNQEKQADSIRKKTLNDTPHHWAMIKTLEELENFRIKYHRKLLNSEHYVTLWKYGIGWSSWVNSTKEIQTTVKKMSVRFYRLPDTDRNGNPEDRLFVNNGQSCWRPTFSNKDATNLIIEGWALRFPELNKKIQNWLQRQIIYPEIFVEQPTPPSIRRETFV